MPKKRKAKPVDWPVLYIVEIDDWDWGFSFGLDKTKRWNDPYSDYRHMEIHGSVLAPSGIKAERADIHLLPNHDLNKANRMEGNWKRQKFSSTIIWFPGACPKNGLLKVSKSARSI